MSHETERAALVARIESLAAELEALNQAAHIENARQALTEAARAGVDDERLAALGDALRRASDGSDEAGQARTIAQARKAAAEAELAELEANERDRLKRLAAAQILTVGEMLREAQGQMREAFHGAFRTHCRLAKLVDKRLDLQAILAGREKGNPCSPANLFALPEVGNGLHGQVVPDLALGYDDPAYKETMAEVAEEIEAALAEVQPIKEPEKEAA